MRVAVSSLGTSLDAWAGIPFGTCSQFLVVDTETMEFVVVSIRPEHQDPTKVSLYAIRAVARQGAEIVIAGAIKDICKETMQSLGMEVIDNVSRMTVREAIEQGGGHPFALEDLAPVGKGQIAGDQQAGPLVAIGEYLKEQLGSGSSEGQIPELVADQQVHLVQLAQELVQAVALLRHLQLADQAGGGEEAGLVAAPTGRQPQGDR